MFQGKTAQILNLILILLSGCISPIGKDEIVLPTLDAAEVTALIPAHVKDRSGWAEDVLAAIRFAQKEPTSERVCAVLAVIEQESNYQVDPQVPGLPRIVRQGLEKKLAPLGSLAQPALDVLLLGKAPGSEVTFGQRIAQLKTERDLDRFFRDLATTYQMNMPGSFAIASAVSLLLGKGGLQNLNPVTTAGPMQVKVSFAVEHAGSDDPSEAAIREFLYTRSGGVQYGTLRLLGFKADYDDIIYRFADYNAGVYASRNAAFQKMLAELTKQNLDLDGDLLAYDKNSEPRDLETKTLQALLLFGLNQKIAASTLRRDARKEKTEDFESTTSWEAVRRAWETKSGTKAPYARLPDVALTSPKLQQPRSTAWFANSVKKRYLSCRSKEHQKDLASSR